MICHQCRIHSGAVCLVARDSMLHAFSVHQDIFRNILHINITLRRSVITDSFCSQETLRRNFSCSELLTLRRDISNCDGDNLDRRLADQRFISVRIGLQRKLLTVRLGGFFISDAVCDLSCKIPHIRLRAADRDVITAALTRKGGFIVSAKKGTCNLQVPFFTFLSTLPRGSARPFRSARPSCRRSRAARSRAGSPAAFP